MGKPSSGYEKFGTEARIQLNDQFASINEISSFISSERSALREELIPFLTVALKVDRKANMGIVGDVLLSDLIGGRATALILLVYVMQLRLLRLQQSDFSYLWADFAVSCGFVSIFQLTFFSLLNMTVPSLGPIVFQFGANLTLFPLGFVLIFAVHQLMQKMKMV